MVQGAEEDDGHDHHATDEAEGPAGSQEGVNVGDENRAQGASAASRRRQPAHVHTLESTFTLRQDAFIQKKNDKRVQKLKLLFPYLRFRSKDFGIQCVGHHVAGWVSNTNEDVG